MQAFFFRYFHTLIYIIKKKIQAKALPIQKYYVP